MIEKFNLAWLSLTYRCNNRCVWCYAASNNPENSQRQLNPEREGGILELIQGLEIPRVTLIGGEPTLYPYLPRMIRELTRRNINVGIVTNGRKFKDREFTKALKESGLNTATFSIEGSCPEVHDKTTQIKGSLEEALEGIKIAQQEGIEVSTNTLISSINIKDLDNNLKMLTERGIKKLGYNVCGICVSEESNNRFIVHPKEAVRAFQKVYEAAKKINVEARLVTPMPYCFFDENKIEELNKKGIIRGGPCQIVSGRNFVIDYNGDIVPCTHLTGFPLFNIFDGGKVISSLEFKRRYNDKVPEQFRLVVSHYPSEKCIDCDKNCSGGCPLYWTKFSPKEELQPK